jgi:tetratricopeptide (TPR) repeat protein
MIDRGRGTFWVIDGRVMRLSGLRFLALGQTSVGIGFLSLLALFVSPDVLAGQVAQAGAGVGTNADKTYAASGRLTVQVQDASGSPFFEGAVVTVLTSDVAERYSTKCDVGGRAGFSALPIGSYLVEIVAPGYRTVRQQVRISGTTEAQDVMISMVPKASGAKEKEKGSVSQQAVKETEKALRSMQANNLGDAELHLQRALATDLNFADANYLMGMLLLRQKDTGRAAAYLQKSLTLSPNHAQVLLALGRAQYLNHDYDHASESFEKFLHDYPGSSQASVAQKYVNAIYTVRLANAAAVRSASASTGSDLNSSAATENAEVGALPEIGAVTEITWAPPDVDEEKVELNATDGCQLNQIIHAAGGRIQELVQNVDHFTATENIEHTNVSPMGLQTSHESRKYNYLVEIHPVGVTNLRVEEYRKASGIHQDFPEDIETVGLPSLALIFHPYLRERYDFQCEGLGSWRGKAAWVVHFQQRADQANGMLTYHIGRRYIAVGLKGRAWVDAETSQIVAMESDIMKPIPEIKLFRDHQLVEYGPVRFRNNTTQLWLPKSADWYCSISGKRFYRRHAFSEFLLFSVDDKQKISAPQIPVEPNPQ